MVESTEWSIVENYSVVIFQAKMVLIFIELMQLDIYEKLYVEKLELQWNFNTKYKTEKIKFVLLYK